MSSIFVVVYPDVQYNINGPGRLYYRHWPTEQSGPLPVQPETNTHFLGRFLPPVHSLLRGLRENPATDYVQGANLPETNTHFLGRFTAPIFSRFRYGSEDAASSTLPAQPSTEPHFVGRHRPVSHAVLRGLRENPATDYIVGGGPPETNVHFIGRFTAPKFAFFQGSAAADAPVAVQSETNTHFVGRFTPVSYTLLRGLRENPATDYVQAPGSPEANPHFLGRYTAPLFNAIRLAGGASDPPVAIQPETNVHFIARFQPASMRHLTDLWQNPATDFASPQPVVSVVAMVNGRLHHHPPAAPGQPTYRNGLL